MENISNRTIIISGDSILEIEEKINILCERLMEWVRVNGLLINLKKTNYMLFSRKRVTNPPRVVMNNENRIQGFKDSRIQGFKIVNTLLYNNNSRKSEKKC